MTEPESRYCFLHGRKLNWIKHIAKDSVYDLWRAEDAGEDFLVTVFRDTFDDQEDQEEFLDLVQKASSVKPNAVLPILGFSVLDEGCDRPVIIYEFCSETSLKDMIKRNDMITVTQKLIILSGVACAAESFENHGLEVGTISSRGVFLDANNEPRFCNYGIGPLLSHDYNEYPVGWFGTFLTTLMVTKTMSSGNDNDEGDEDDSSSDSSVMPSMPNFFVDLCSEFDDGGCTTFGDVVRAFMSTGFIVEGADAKAVHEYQMRTISPELSKKVIINLYQQTETRKASMDELQSRVEFLTKEIKRLKKNMRLGQDIEVDTAKMATEMESYRRQMTDIIYGFRCARSPHTKMIIPFNQERSGMFLQLVTNWSSQCNSTVFTSMSSGGIHSLIDEKSAVPFFGGSDNLEWVQFEFQRNISIVSVRVQSADVSFPRTWSFSCMDDGKRKVLYRVEDDERLNGPFKAVTVNIRATRGKIFRIEKRGHNWSDTDLFVLKHVELYSEEPVYLGGVFKTLIKESGDVHRAQLRLEASNFDFTQLHLMSPSHPISTLSGTGRPWIQFELAYGRAIVHGYRMRQLEDHQFDSWSVQGSSDGKNWTLIDRQEHGKEPGSLKMVECCTEIPFKMFRLVYESDEDARSNILRIFHFDIFGVYWGLSDGSVRVA